MNGTPQPDGLVPVDDPRPHPPTREELDPAIAALLKRDSAGLVPAVVQEQSSRRVLMVGWMDDAALHRTLTSGRSVFYSRSREEYWVKGETSGHRQWVREVRLDCDGDTLLILVQQDGPACHTGNRTCFDDTVLPAVVLDRQAAHSSDNAGSSEVARSSAVPAGEREPVLP